MGILSRLRGIDRRYWYVCYNCMMQTGHDTVNSLFYSEGPLVDVVGRPLMPCPRCGNTNTKSFQTLKDEGAEAPLWGLEQTVRKHPRGHFMVKPKSGSTIPPAGSETRSSVQ
ncbi:MAG TPA: hypothetical protein VGZ29_12040 [Terriglobia bacterium]|nr:hypothetical protein [Terriglobia bacterium]